MNGVLVCVCVCVCVCVLWVRCCSSGVDGVNGVLVCVCVCVCVWMCVCNMGLECRPSVCLYLAVLYLNAHN